ncbi:NUDIX hydrolase [Hydrogenophaga aromaticivorans]|uniref:NUDIX hydrolase n=1 Tax=Hydrogenophaga aromaticivorans TaxID=2610898 RepID=UPI001B35DD61|nr:NUDIX domain-containing protein [Hydrogenophaga aromaticivorans]MBQ0917752.1 NUDIX hydrolase [Hydrogenophaga aromaticivorans]
MSEHRELFPLVGVDVALFSVVDERLKVLLVKRAREPEAKRWALPGGMLKPHLDPSLAGTARRMLADKVAVELPHLEEVGTYSGPDRDPRGWSVTVLFYALLPLDKIGAVVRNKVEAVDWADAASPGHRLAFDHAEQLSAAVKKLRAKVADDALPLHLLPDKFTLTQLQTVAEVILGHPVDKSSFRRRLKTSKDLVVLDEFVRGAQRPAQLFKASEGFSF